MRFSYVLGFQAPRNRLEGSLGPPDPSTTTQGHLFYNRNIYIIKKASLRGRGKVWGSQRHHQSIPRIEKPIRIQKKPKNVDFWHF